MALTLPSIPSLPSISLPKVTSFAKSPAAVLNGISVLASNLPKLNPRTPIYAIVNAETFIPLALPDSWQEVTPRLAEYQVADYPIEDGAFLAYNKVRRPMSVEAVLIKEGSDLARATWLEAIRQQLAVDPQARYNVITPNGLFNSMTITRLDFQTRQDKGSNLLYLNMQLSEVLQIVSPSMLGANVRVPESGPLAAVGRVFSSITDTATAALARARAPVNSALTLFGTN